MVTFDVWSKEANDKSNNKNKRSSKFIRCFNFWKVLVKEIAIIVLLIFLPLISLKNQCNFLFHLEVFVWCVLSFLCHTFWIHLIFYLHLANRRNICEYLFMPWSQLNLLPPLCTHYKTGWLCQSHLFSPRHHELSAFFYSLFGLLKRFFTSLRFVVKESFKFFDAAKFDSRLPIRIYRPYFLYLMQDCSNCLSSHKRLVQGCPI